MSDEVRGAAFLIIVAAIIIGVMDANPRTSRLTATAWYVALLLMVSITTLFPHSFTTELAVYSLIAVFAGLTWQTTKSLSGFAARQGYSAKLGGLVVIPILALLILLLPKRGKARTNAQEVKRAQQSRQEAARKLSGSATARIAIELRPDLAAEWARYVELGPEWSEAFISEVEKTPNASAERVTRSIKEVEGQGNPFQSEEAAQLHDDLGSLGREVQVQFRRALHVFRDSMSPTEVGHLVRKKYE